MKRLRLKSRLFLPSLLLAFCFATGGLVKAQKFNIGFLSGEIKAGQVVVDKISESYLRELKKKGVDNEDGYKYLNEPLENACRDLRRRHKSIDEFVYDGITYKVKEDEKEGTLLVLTGDEGCSPAPYTGVFAALGVLGEFKPMCAILPCINGYVDEVEYEKVIEPEVQIDQVIIKGCIKKIRYGFLLPDDCRKNENPYREKDGEPEYIGRGMTKVKRIDMSKSDVDVIQFGAFNFLNKEDVKEIILPSHPVRVAGAFCPQYASDKQYGIPDEQRKVKIIGSEFMVPLTDKRNGDEYKDSCCSVQ